VDPYGRAVDSLRISITQRCDFNCFFCHEEGECDHGGEATAEEIEALAAVAAELGIRRIKLTGGEPLIREDVVDVVLRVAAHVEEVSMTTNGFHLAERAREKGLRIVDATCPFVKRAQKLARSLSRKGYVVILVGDKSHPEVKGLKSYVEGETLVVGAPKELAHWAGAKKVGVVAQTTQDFNKVNQILKILKRKTKDFQWKNTLCPEVLSRQKELFQILKKADGVLVIGSQTSANTGRLTKMVKNAKRKLFWINSPENLKRIDFKKVSVLGVVSGTSAPNWEIEKIKKWLDTKQK